MSFLPGLIYIGLIGGAVIKNSLKSEMKKIDVKVAAEKIKKNYFDYIIDVRSLEEYQEGHLDNVLFYESLVSNHELIEQVKNDIKDKNAKILIYCRSGSRSSKAGNLLVENGFTNIYITINGGYTELAKSI